MRLRLALTIVCMMTLPAASLGAIIRVLHDHFDSQQCVRVAQMYPEVDEQKRALEAFLKHVVPHTLAEVEQILGQPVGSQPDSSYAMPLCQSRLVGFGGLGSKPLRIHREFYPIQDIGGLQVWYHKDGTQVATCVVYLKTDSLFMPYNRQTQNKLGTRLSWDENRLAIFERTICQIFGKPDPPNSVLQPAAPREERE